jgi:hypothetical protein
MINALLLVLRLTLSTSPVFVDSIDGRTATLIVGDVSYQAPVSSLPRCARVEGATYQGTTCISGDVCSANYSADNGATIKL